jgi:hypothetical protein
MFIRNLQTAVKPPDGFVPTGIEATRHVLRVEVALAALALCRLRRLESRRPALNRSGPRHVGRRLRARRMLLSA